ncbi:PKD domain-containing protein [Niastella yeongjuensis]|uniref:PKD domain-containing protein n=1 Tax=Niastella yeongjuensis TaxID=354355 RepID=UPI0008C2496A|nr:PKD domain-containing protein [Niastella yeongjuensis]SEP40532.1 PKD domain-containing protein [Niastella yeongjuensis]
MKYILYILLLYAPLAACKKEEARPLSVDFSYAIENNDFTAPVKVTVTNNTLGATNYKWTFVGGDPAASNKKDPGTIVFNSAGDLSIILEAWNDDNRDTLTRQLMADSTVAIAFDAVVQVNDFVPARVTIINKSAGGVNYNWTFEGGQPATAAVKDPGTIVFNTPGEHVLTLVLNNGRKDFTLTKKIWLQPAIQAAFTIIPSFDDNDQEAPLTATLHNETSSGLYWKWSVSGGGVIDNDTAREPTVHFASGGTYTVTLLAGNDKETKTVQHAITVLPNSNLRTFHDVQLGINTAHSTIGCFFSTKLQRSFKASDDLTTAGKDIDLVFFGLNQNFTYNRFITPDSSADYTFNAIPGAQPVTIINSPEQCNCGAAMTPVEFDGMTNDVLLAGMAINFTTAGGRQFTNSVTPHIVLFKTSDGRKGAVKIKQFVSNGSGSYIVADIKVQKTP